MFTIDVATPAELSAQELDEFVDMVRAGGEVTAHGLRDRVVASQCISRMYAQTRLLGVAGLKRPLDSYRLRVQEGAKFPLSPAEYPCELGWVFIHPDARGRRLSVPLCRGVVAASGRAGIFATSAVSKANMHRTLEKLGFAQVGSSWNSSRSDNGLLLFVKGAAETELGRVDESSLD